MSNHKPNVTCMVLAASEVIQIILFCVCLKTIERTRYLNSPPYRYRCIRGKFWYSICKNERQKLSRSKGETLEVRAPFLISITPVLPLSGTLIMLSVLSVGSGMSENRQKSRNLIVCDRETRL